MSLLKDTMDPKKIKYEKPEKSGSFYYAPMCYDKVTPLHIQTPRMRLTHSGAEILEKTHPSVDVETISSDFRFYDLMIAIDDRNVKETFKNNKEWFGKEIPLELIDDMYKRSTKPAKADAKPQFSYKLPILKGEVQCPIFDQHRNRREFSTLQEGAEIILVIHIRGLKFLKQNYYCDMYVSQIKVFVPKDQKYAILDECLIDDDEEERSNDILDEAILEEARKKKEEERIALESKISEKSKNSKNRFFSQTKQINNYFGRRGTNL